MKFGILTQDGDIALSVHRIRTRGQKVEIDYGNVWGDVGKYKDEARAKAVVMEIKNWLSFKQYKEDPIFVMPKE